jgi:Alpha/beta hydrolase domain
VLETFTVTKTSPVAGRPYEWVSARAQYAVDPEDRGTARVADLGLVPRDPDGKVRFSGDVVLLRPTDGGNGRALLAVPNRGMAMLPFCGSAMRFVGTGEAADLGNGYLLNEGWTVALAGWQWDVPDGFIGLTPPFVDVKPGWMRADFRIDVPISERGLSDAIPLGPGRPPLAFAAYPTSDVDDPEATLRVRVAQMGPSEIIPRSAWSFTSPTTLALEGGFQPNRWYELIYRSSRAPVVGTGLLAVRDFGAYLRDGHAGVFASGQSQCGRFLRELLFEGLNLTEDGRQVFDGVLIEIASARRGEFNRRYAQPGLLAPMMPEYGPPYDSSSLLDRQRERGGVPKVFFVNSAAEYWRGDAALVHQDPVTGADLPEDPDARAYLVSGTDHIGNMAGARQLKEMMPVANPPHFLDQGPVTKALFVQLQQWALDGVQPTPSMVPRAADGTAVTRETVLESFPASTRPDPAVLPYTPEIDPDVVEWPLPLGEPRVALVSAVDERGNEIAGIRVPAVETGVAAYAGWNPRRHIDGLPDVLYDLLGGRLPRLSGQAPSVEDLRAAALGLAERRLILRADVDLVTEQAIAELEQHGE